MPRAREHFVPGEDVTFGDLVEGSLMASVLAELVRSHVNGESHNPQLIIDGEVAPNGVSVPVKITINIGVGAEAETVPAN
jgi:hypothetical protein